MSQSRKKKVLLLGATGSIGSQTLDVLRQHPDDFILCGVSAGSSAGKLREIVDEFPDIEMAGLSSLDHNENWNGVKVFGGEHQMEQLVKELDYDILVNSVVGFRGLKPTLEAIRRGRDIALANKESLVCGGELVAKALEKSPSTLYPVDSEHSAIYQCLKGSRPEDVSRLIITASGGSLRNLERSELENITPQRALQHPSWNMGARITIDSATMVNKGFEVIEAHYLFGLPYEQISTVLHPQSIVHSMVEYNDHAIIAQLGSADMRLPIQYALYDSHLPHLHEENPLDMSSTLSLQFLEMDHERYPMLKTAIEAGKRKGNAGCILNAADEQAVELFLQGKISFLQIEEAIRMALETAEYIADPDYEDLLSTDLKTRKLVRERYL